MSEEDYFQKKLKFNSFFSNILKNYWQTLIFIIIIVSIILLLKYVQNHLKLPGTKKILNWFVILVIGNILITYTILITYQQVKNQPGIPGSEGYQGAEGDQGFSNSCSTCQKKLDVLEQPYEDLNIKQPILPFDFKVETKGKEIKIPDPEESTFEIENDKNRYIQEVIFWTSTNARGGSLKKIPGNYPRIPYSLRGYNNNIESMFVPEGYWVTLYQYADYGGQSQIFKSGFHKSIGNFRNRFSSFKFYQAPDLTKASLWEESDGKGKLVILEIGNYPVISQERFNINTIMSLRVPSGYVLTLYQNIDYDGKSQIFTQGYYKYIGDYLAGNVKSAKFSKIPSNRVILGKETFFKGHTIKLTIGNHNIDSGWIKNINSVIIPSGLRMLIYKQKDQKGKHIILKGIHLDLSKVVDSSQNKVNNIIESVVIEKDVNTSATLHADTYFGGDTMSIDLGDHNLPMIWTKKLRSISVPSKHKLILYSKPNQKGYSKSFTSSEGNLSMFNWDKTSRKIYNNVYSLRYQRL